MQSNKEQGYALIVALMAVLLLTFLGITAFMLSSQDFVIGNRLIHDKKVFSAAQEGIHDLVYNFNPSNPEAITRKNATDPDCYYSATKPVSSVAPYYSGPGNSPDRAYALYESDVTAIYKDSVTKIEVGIQLGYGPVPITTNY